MNQHLKNPRQREHQANERTFLAWMRTSISLIGFGLAIARFGLFLQQSAGTSQISQMWLNSHSLGVGLIVVGIAIVALAALRYNQVYWQIERANYRPNRWLILLVAGLVASLGALSLPIVWGGKQQPDLARPEISSQIQPR